MRASVYYPFAFATLTVGTEKRREVELSHFAHTAPVAGLFRSASCPSKAPKWGWLHHRPQPLSTNDRHDTHAGLTHQFARSALFLSLTHTLRHRRDDRSPARRRRHEKTGTTSSDAPFKVSRSAPCSCNLGSRNNAGRNIEKKNNPSSPRYFQPSGRGGPSQLHNTPDKSDQVLYLEPCLASNVR